MFIIFRNLNLLISQNPNPFSHNNCFRVSSFSPNRCFFFFIRSSPLMASTSSSSKIVAEYAKSSRSTCKKCAETISSKTLRLGLVSKDPRGFEATKWHHFNCFPMDSQSFVSVENIDGFSSLENSDQEVLKNLKAECEVSPKETEEQGEIEGSDEKKLKESKVHKADEVAVGKLEGSNSKKPKGRLTLRIDDDR